MIIPRKKYIGIGLMISLFSSFAFANDNKSKRTKNFAEPLSINVIAWGPTQIEVDAAKIRVEQSFQVQKELAGTKYRLISFNYIENENKNQAAQPPTRFRMVFYDYTRNRTFVAESDFAGRELISIREEKFEPSLGSEELKDAFELIKNDEKLGLAINQNKLQIFEAMPPITMLNGERLVNVGIKTMPDGDNKVIGVSFRSDKIFYYENDAPPTSLSAPNACGIPSAGQGSTSNGTAGQYQLTVLQSGSPLWEMLVIRPSASSGNSGERSGIEVRDVKYKGKSVLKRGHVPVLNVQYSGNQCGPYRDWQFQEGFFDAPAAGASNPAPGIRVLAPGQTAQTALDSGVDSGNFLGVAIYTQDVGFGNEVVMVSEMDAGWYRYIMEWRFSQDGTIRPRYGYGATNNSCVCFAHNHHTYWRFDFDIVSPTNKIFQIERGRKFLTPVTNEATRLRNYQTNRGFLIQNSSSDEAYTIVPNLTDGVTDTFGGGDFWLLKYKDGPGELDDPNTGTAANLNPWVNSESLVDQDVVVWYAAHFIHADGANRISPNRSGEVLTNSHVVGPDLRPIRW